MDLSSLNKKKLVLAMAASVSLLVACTSGEERQQQYYEKAKTLYEQGNMEKARVEVKNVLQINPEHADARYLMALLEERDQNWQAVFPNLMKAIEINPSHIKARIKLGTLMIAMGAPAQGEEQAKEVVKLDPKNPSGPLLYAGIYLKQGKTDEAMAKVEEALKLDPANEDAIGLKATILAPTDVDKAIATLDAAIAQSKDPSVLSMIKIRVLESRGRFEEALPLYAALSKSEPDNAYYVRRQVDLLTGLKRTDEAEKLLRGFVDANAEKVEYKLWLVEFLAAKRDIDVAETALQGFIQKEPKSWRLKEGLGRLYALTDQRDKARAVFEEIRKNESDREAVLSASNKLVDLAVADGKFDDAKKLVNEVLATEPENIEALMQRARFALRDRDHGAAIADLRVVLKLSPDSVPALNLMAGAQLQANAPDLALEHYDRALSFEAGNGEALLRSAELLMQQGQAERGEQRLKELLARYPGNPDGSQVLIEYYARGQQWDKALELVDVLAKGERTKPMADYWQGVIDLRRGKTEEGIAALKRSFDAAPQSQTTLKALVAAYAGAGRADEAEVLLKAEVQKQPEAPQLQDLLAQVYRQKGDSAGAAAIYQQLVEKFPKYLPAYLAQVDASRQKGDVDGALAIIERALAQLPEAHGILLVKAELLASTGKYDQARDAYEQVLAKLPNSEIAKNNLASLLLDRYQGEEVMRRVQTLVAGFESSKLPAFLDTAGWYHYKAGNAPQAVSLLKAAVAGDSATALYRYHLGMAYHKDGQPAQAREQLELALKSPGFEGAEEAKKLLETLPAK